MSDSEIQANESSKRGEIAKVILGVVAAGVLVAAVAVAPGLTLLVGAFMPSRSFRARSVGRSLRNLERRGYVRRQLTGQSVSLTLTSRGHQRLDRFLLDDLTLPDPDPRNWDNRWRLVLFDVPEERRYLRTIFRRKLQALGLSYVQRSVWLYPFACEKELQEIARRLGIEDTIAVIVTDSFSWAPKYHRRYKLAQKAALVHI